MDGWRDARGSEEEGGGSGRLASEVTRQMGRDGRQTEGGVDEKARERREEN